LNYKNISIASKIISLVVSALTSMAIITVIVFTSTSSLEDIFQDFSQTDTKLLTLSKDIKYQVSQVQQLLTDISATRAAKGFDDGFDEAAKYAKLTLDSISQLHSLAQSNYTDSDKVELEHVASTLQVKRWLIYI
jgi:methyl-accepting chemotaxis protein